MDVEELKRIIGIFETSSLSELEIEEGGTRLRLVKKTNLPSTLPLEIAVSTEKEKEEKEEEKTAKEVSVRSPLVGTFYRAHSPEEEPFVEVGDYVRPGQTLCIIEAMKVMNEITSEVAGKVK
ncbi:acetyl-CoA carboxylase, biotin carboxyl carrier protein, partial [Candidatus Aerophobetes bacterium]|nr:acetyl-CoA carboxylase, biotin carboxyl carrier protein [Candidatus Aerophobetes bacterium]